MNEFEFDTIEKQVGRCVGQLRRSVSIIAGHIERGEDDRIWTELDRMEYTAEEVDEWMQKYFERSALGFFQKLLAKIRRHKEYTFHL